MTKTERRTAIKDRAEATKKPTNYAVYWLTRDMRDGVLDAHCQVWLARPERVVLEALGPGNVMWMARKPDGESALYAQWELGFCLVECRVVPDDSLMSIRVGPEPEPELASTS